MGKILNGAIAPYKQICFFSRETHEINQIRGLKTSIK